MSLAALYKLANRAMPNKKLVQSWWPKPKIKAVPKGYWGTRPSNNTGVLHKYKCTSFSMIGFVANTPNTEGMPSLICLAYGETPEQAYDQWCYIFSVWNKKEDWVK